MWISTGLLCQFVVLDLSVNGYILESVLGYNFEHNRNNYSLAGFLLLLATPYWRVPKRTKQLSTVWSCWLSPSSYSYRFTDKLISTYFTSHSFYFTQVFTVHAIWVKRLLKVTKMTCLITACPSSLLKALSNGLKIVTICRHTSTVFFFFTLVSLLYYLKTMEFWWLIRSKLSYIINEVAV